MGRRNRLEVHPLVRGHSVIPDPNLLTIGSRYVGEFRKAPIDRHQGFFCHCGWYSHLSKQYPGRRTNSRPPMPRPQQKSNIVSATAGCTIRARARLANWEQQCAHAARGQEESVRSDRGRNGRPGRHPRVRVHPAEKARGLLSIDLERAAGVGASLKAHFSFATSKLNSQAGREK